jgi:putative transposase
MRASLLVEEKIEPLPPSPEQIGADLGLTSMVITSKGEKVGNPRFFATDEKKLVKAQKRHARKQKNSKNQEKARRKVAKIHARIADRRRDYQHKLSTRLIRENPRDLRREFGGQEYDAEPLAFRRPLPMLDGASSCDN